MTSETTGATSSGLRLGRIRQIAVPVSDLERAVEFYRDRLGAKLLATFDPPGLAFFDFEGVRVMLSRPEGSEQLASSPLYFSVPEIHAAFEEFSARGLEWAGEPHMIFRDDAGTFGAPGHETWMVFFRDPDGNLLALMAEQPAAG